MSRNILFVVEGGRSEPRFLDNLMRTFRSDEKYEVFTYGTNIHKMIEGMMVGGDIDYNLEFLDYLRSVNNNKEDEQILDKRFSDIFLFFDMDPQDPKYDPEMMLKATEYFSDSTDNGKLYINYPMLESYRHVSSLKDLSFLTLTVRPSEIRTYKKRVDREALPELTQLSRITKEIWLRLIELNLRKTESLLGYGTELPDYGKYVSGCSQKAILEKQLDAVRNEDLIYVLNTSLFSVVDYNPSEMLTLISNQRLSFIL